MLQQLIRLSDLLQRSSICSKRVLKAVGGLALFLVLIVPARTLPAQTFYGSISGVVKDPSGAIVPGVAVTVRENKHRDGI